MCADKLFEPDRRGESDKLDRGDWDLLRKRILDSGYHNWSSFFFWFEFFVFFVSLILGGVLVDLSEVCLCGQEGNGSIELD